VGVFPWRVGPSGRRSTGQRQSACAAPTGFERDHAAEPVSCACAPQRALVLWAWAAYFLWFWDDVGLGTGLESLGPGLGLGLSEMGSLWDWVSWDTRAEEDGAGEMQEDGVDWMDGSLDRELRVEAGTRKEDE